MMIGFGFGGLLIAVDEMLKGFSLRAFSATTFGLLLGSVGRLLIDHSGLFENADEKVRWLIRLGLFLGFGYIGIVLAMRSNKEDFSLIIPYVRFSPQNKPDNLLLLDTSVIIDGRIADLIEIQIHRRPGGRAALCAARNCSKSPIPPTPSNAPAAGADLKCSTASSTTPSIEVRIHDGDFPEEKEVDAKLVRLARNLNAKLFTNDYNLGQSRRPAKRHLRQPQRNRQLPEGRCCFPAKCCSLKIVREGKDKGQGIGYLPDGTMVVVNNGQAIIGQQVEVQVQSLLQTGAGVIVFADIRQPQTDTDFIANNRMDFVTVFNAFNLADAQLVRSRLEAADFHPFVANENSASGSTAIAARQRSSSKCRKPKPPTRRNFSIQPNDSAK